MPRRTRLTAAVALALLPLTPYAARAACTTRQYGGWTYYPAPSSDVIADPRGALGAGRDTVLWSRTTVMTTTDRCAWRTAYALPLTPDSPDAPWSQHTASIASVAIGRDGHGALVTWIALQPVNPDLPGWTLLRVTGDGAPVQVRPPVDDAGATWTVSTAAHAAQRAFVLVRRTQGGRKLYVTDNAGASWNLTSDYPDPTPGAIPPYPRLDTCCTVDEQGAVYADGQADPVWTGTLVSTDRLRTWHRAFAGFTLHALRHDKGRPARILGADPGNHPVLSFDGGRSFAPLYGAISAQHVCFGGSRDTAMYQGSAVHESQPTGGFFTVRALRAKQPVTVEQLDPRTMPGLVDGPPSTRTSVMLDGGDCTAFTVLVAAPTNPPKVLGVAPVAPVEPGPTLRFLAVRAV